MKEYKCTVCNKKSENEAKLREHVLQTKHYYKPANILVEDEDDKHVEFKQLMKEYDNKLKEYAEKYKKEIDEKMWDEIDKKDRAKKIDIFKQSVIKYNEENRKKYHISFKELYI